MAEAKTIDEFNEQAKAFVAKAKSQGASNTGIMNTIQLKYAQFLQGLQNQLTPYQQAQIDIQKQGSWNLVDTNGDGIVDTEYNPQTGESRKYEAAGVTQGDSIIDQIYAKGPSGENQITPEQPMPMSINQDSGQMDIVSPSNSMLNTSDPNNPGKSLSESLNQINNQATGNSSSDVNLSSYGNIPITYSSMGEQPTVDSSGMVQSPVGNVSNLYNAQAGLQWPEWLQKLAGK